MSIDLDLESVTRCSNGHPLTEENAYVHDGRRHCRTCNREAVRRYATRNRTENLEVPNGGWTDAARERNFWRRVTKTETCWLWTGAKASGYGRVLWNGTWKGAHRLTYEWLVGPIPPGLVIDHICRVRNCVNPSHLRPLTNAENVMLGESPAAQNRRKTHCKRGHPFTGTNLIILKSGYRQCAACLWDRKQAQK